MPMRLKKPHCSSLDRIFACQGSILPADGWIEAGGPDALLGRARHEALSYIPQGIDPPVLELAAKHGVEVDELSIAVAMGRRAWDEIGEYFPSPDVERKLESQVCIGTADVIQEVIDCDAGLQALRIEDWKTGYGTDLHPYQLKGYAHCAVEEFGWPGNGVVTVFEVWTSHRQIETTNLDRDDLEAFAANLGQIIECASSDPDRLEYRAGSHCRWCPHRYSCEVNAAWMRESTTALVAVDHGRPVTRQILGELYLKAQEVERAIRKFWAVVDVALEDGPLILPDGRRVERVETEREKISAAIAIDTLRDQMTPGEIVEIMGDLPKTRLDAWAKAHAGRGKKAALMREIYGALREADAIRSEPYRQRKILG